MLTATFIVCLLGNLQTPDGTIVVLENSNPVVEACTNSAVTHVALILNFGNQAWVYEATPAEVRRLTLSDYVAEIAELNRGRSEDGRVRLRLYQPKRAYTADECRRILWFVNSQLGRRYSVRGYVRGRPGDGIHCAEFVSTALARTGRYPFRENYSITPTSLVTQIQPTHARAVEIHPPKLATHASWCERSWNWWAGAFDWCRWACWDTWTICR